MFNKNNEQAGLSHEEQLAIIHKRIEEAHQQAELANAKMERIFELENYQIGIFIFCYTCIFAMMWKPDYFQVFMALALFGICVVMVIGYKIQTL